MFSSVFSFCRAFGGARQSIALIFCVLFGWGCGGNKGDVQLLTYIPPDAVTVLMLNIKQLHEKANVEELKKIPLLQNWLKGMEQAEAEKMTVLMKNPEETGIALQKVYGFNRLRSGNTASEFFSALLIPLKDEARWEKVLKSIFEQNKMTFDTKKGEGHTYIQWFDDVYFAWNGRFATLAGSLSKTANSLPDIAQLFAPIPEPKTEEDKKKAKNIGEVAEFQKLHNENRDILFWWNPDAQIDAVFSDKRGSREYAGYLFLLGLSSAMIKGNHFALWYDFKNGSIETGLHYRLSPALEERFGDFFKKQMETDFAPYLPKAGLAAVQTVAVNPAAISKLLKERKMDLPANMWLGATAGINTDVLAAGLGGDMAFATYLPSEEMLEKGGGMEFVAAISIKNAEVSEKLLAVIAALAQARVVKKAKGYELYPQGMTLPFYVTTNKEMMVLSMNAEVAQRVETGGFDAANRASDSYMQALQKGNLGIYFDHRVTAGGKIGAVGFGLGMSGWVNPMVADVLADYNEITETTIVFGKQDAKATILLKTKDKNSLQKVLELSHDAYGSWSEIQEDLWSQEVQ